MKSHTSINVRYAETDQMGIVHHSVYAIWFEAARTDWIRQLGMRYSQLEQSGILLPLVDLSCHFIDAAQYEDVLDVTAQISRLTPARIQFSYTVTNTATGRLLCTGSTTHAWVGENFKVISLKKHNPQLYALLSASIGEE